MCQLIKNNPNIKGLDLYSITQILSQFADDTAAFLSYDLLTLESFSTVLSDVDHNLGLKISYDKTAIYRIRSLYNSDAKLVTQKEYLWSNEPMNVLGTYVSCNGEQ